MTVNTKKGNFFLLKLGGRGNAAEGERKKEDDNFINFFPSRKLTGTV